MIKGGKFQKAARDEATRDEAVRDEAVRDEAAWDEATRDEATRDEAARDEATRDEAARDNVFRARAQLKRHNSIDTDKAIFLNEDLTAKRVSLAYKTSLLKLEKKQSLTAGLTPEEY